MVISEKQMRRNVSFPTAIHILTLLGYMGHEFVSSAFIAQSVQTNPALVRKLLSKLANVGLVETAHGKTGGARLSREATNINLKEVYDAVQEEGVLFIPEREIYAPCPVSSNIKSVLQETFDEEEAALGARLKCIKLSSVLQKIP